LEFLATFWAMGSVDYQDRGAKLAGLNKGAEQVVHEERGCHDNNTAESYPSKHYQRLAIQKIPIKKGPWRVRSSWSHF